jgi:hypothetical protein
MEHLAEVEAPKPEKERLYQSFDAFRDRHPWVGSDNVRPKSIVRDMLERAMTFKDYVNHYGLKRSEGVVLRYLSDCYKALIQNVPDDAKTDELDDITEWLGAIVRHVDSSLIDEWERLIAPDPDVDAAAPVRRIAATVVDDERAFRVMVRNQVFEWAQRLARRTGYDALLVDPVDPDRFASIEDIVTVMGPYWERFDAIDLGPEARSPDRFVYEPRIGRVAQVLLDPDETNEWRIEAVVDVEASIEQGRAVLRLVDIVDDSVS